jgi:hypothetical protein
MLVRRGTTIADNNATNYAGGFRCIDNCTAELHSTLFLRNYAGINGAGLVLGTAAQV